LAEPSITIEGLDEFLRKNANPQELLKGPLRKFFTRSAITVQRNAKKLAPVDTGRLRSSIETDVDKSTLPLFATIGTNVKYAPYMEYGTARNSDSPRRGKRSHFPPPGALDLWARRHGIANGFVVAQAIFDKGGLEPRKFMRDGLRDSLPNINSNLNRLSEDIEKAWQD